MIEHTHAKEHVTRGPTSWVAPIIAALFALPFLWIAAFWFLRGNLVGLMYLGVAAVVLFVAYKLVPQPQWVRVSESGVEVFFLGQRRKLGWHEVAFEVQAVGVGVVDGREAQIVRVAITSADEPVCYVVPRWANVEHVLRSIALKRFEPTARYDVASGALAHAGVPQAKA